MPGRAECGTLTRAHASPSACKSSATRTTEQAPESGSVHRFCTSLLRQHLPPCSRALPLALHCLYSGIVKETFVVFVWGLEAYAPDDPRRRLEKDAGDTADDAHQIHRGRQMRRSGAPEAAAAASRPLAQSVAFLGHYYCAAKFMPKAKTAWLSLPYSCVYSERGGPRTTQAYLFLPPAPPAVYHRRLDRQKP